MLKNDEFFWVPSKTSNAACRSWGGSEGDFAKLWENSATRWQAIRHKLARLGIPAPSGRIIEFGSGMGLLGDLLYESCSCLVMVDQCDAYIRERARPLSARCRHVLWSPEGLARLQAEPPSYDWFIALAVFWHVDDPTAAALIREFGKLARRWLCSDPRLEFGHCREGAGDEHPTPTLRYVSYVCPQPGSAGTNA
jgi:2-polyprenyl-3-methyl-5-hydroxy-6-metoxy-1,4-benzoquinol methylase